VYNHIIGIKMTPHYLRLCLIDKINA